MEVATRTCAYTSLIIISFLGMGHNYSVTKQAFDFMLSKTPILRAALTICRLTDDIVAISLREKRTRTFMGGVLHRRAQRIEKRRRFGIQIWDRGSLERHKRGLPQTN